LDTPASVNSGHTSLNEILEKITDREETVKKLMEIAISMKQRQRDVREAELELEKYKSETDRLQAKLIEAEKILELSLHQAKEKLKSIKKSHQGTVSLEDLISYAHKISLANSVASPIGWQGNDPRKPYPSDSHMRSGFLGQLSASQKMNGSRKGTFELSSPPKNQGSGNKKSTTNHPQNIQGSIHHDTEFMTEDSSSSSEEDR
jgi:mediator of RNA polymerase II transcription subunit 4